MHQPTTVFVGLDVHKESISVAIADGGLRGEVRFFGTIGTQPAALGKLAERLGRKGRLASSFRGPCSPSLFETRRRMKVRSGLACGRDHVS